MTTDEQHRRDHRDGPRLVHRPPAAGLVHRPGGRPGRPRGDHRRRHPAAARGRRRTPRTPSGRRRPTAGPAASARTTRDQRIAIAREAEHRFDRKVAWGVEVGRPARAVHPPRRAGDDPAAPARAAGARHPGRGRASPGPAPRRWPGRCGWSARNAEAWLGELREAMEQVERVRAQGPDRSAGSAPAGDAARATSVLSRSPARPRCSARANAARVRAWNTSWKPNQRGDGLGRFRCVDDGADAVEAAADGEQRDDRGAAGRGRSPGCRRRRPSPGPGRPACRASAGRPPTAPGTRCPPSAADQTIQSSAVPPSLVQQDHR